ncbi:hypothetical protein LX87_03834 [Larkinella arboricola]|uniref:O-antigen polysaccharide polymerase Wzy-like protein n=1 Tax=Larkinella arboricola TaxID=643671 RepID=A0A327WUR1_LARAB|nr:hypothetical protein [Larkinella arboricola]RAJ96084.1 hypothetical protein LX87_03834 [Larkinella arboricola]
MISVKANPSYPYINPDSRQGEVTKSIKVKEPFLYVFKKWSSVIIAIAGILQLLFFWSPANLFSVSCVWLAWWLTDKFVLVSSKLSRFTLSTLILLGYAITQYFLPIVFTLVEGKELVFNLKMPYDIFTHSLAAFVVMLIAHHLYTNNKLMNGIFRVKLQKFLTSKYFYTPPTDGQIWFIGITGLVCMFVSYFFVKQDYNNYSEGSGNKFMEAFIPFTYAPYFLLLKELYGGTTHKKTKKLYIQIILFTVALLAVGIGGNARSLFIKGFVAAGITYFLGLLLGRFNYEKIFTIKNVIILALGFVVVTGPLADIATAMVIVRGQRGSISKMEMLVRTLEIFKDKDAIRAYKLAAVDRKVSEWDEHYFDNLFLARFCNLKYNDASLELADKIGEVDREMRNYSIDRFWSTFPKPVLEFLHIDVNKDFVTSCSYGDYLFLRAGGYNALGGFRTGQFAGTGMAAFGWWYLLILLTGIVLAFFIFDLFVVHKVKGNYNTVYLSLIGLLPITSTFTFMASSSTSESVMNIFNFLIRGWIQISLLYFLLFIVSKKLLGLFSRKPNLAYRNVEIKRSVNY